MKFDQWIEQYVEDIDIEDVMDLEKYSFRTGVGYFGGFLLGAATQMGLIEKGGLKEAVIARMKGARGAYYLTYLLPLGTAALLGGYFKQQQEKHAAQLIEKYAYLENKPRRAVPRHNKE